MNKRLEIIPDAFRVAVTSYSMWSIFVALGLLTAPEIIYAYLGVDTNPQVWWALLAVTLLFGAVGRIIKQTQKGAWTRRILILIVTALVLAWAVPSLAMGLYPQSKPVAEGPNGPPTWVETVEILTPLVAKWEGKRNTAYFDIVGVPTICFGHTRTIGPADVASGTTWSDGRCEALLRDELHEYWFETRQGFSPETLGRRLTPERDAAYASLSFNVGWAGVRGSTATHRLNAGDIVGGCKALTWWNKAGGRVVRGLVNRRAEEYALCIAGATT